MARGLPIFIAEDFSKFAHAFGYKSHEAISTGVNRPENIFFYSYTAL